MCAHLGPFGVGDLVCTNDERHDENARGGHTYSGSWAADRHDTTEARDD